MLPLARSGCHPKFRWLSRPSWRDYLRRYFCQRLVTLQLCQCRHVDEIGRGLRVQISNFQEPELEHFQSVVGREGRLMLWLQLILALERSVGRLKTGKCSKLQRMYRTACNTGAGALGVGGSAGLQGGVGFGCFAGRKLWWFSHSLAEILDLRDSMSQAACVPSSSAGENGITVHVAGGRTFRP
jgi:hypothetical protein